MTEVKGTLFSWWCSKSDTIERGELGSFVSIVLSIYWLCIGYLVSSSSSS